MKRAKGDFRGLVLAKQTHRPSSDGEALLFKTAPGVGTNKVIGSQPAALLRFPTDPHWTDGGGASYQQNTQLGGFRATETG